MATSQVTQLLVGRSAKGKYPAVQGSELSVNMYKSDNGGKVFMESEKANWQENMRWNMKMNTTPLYIFITKPICRRS